MSTSPGFEYPRPTTTPSRVRTIRAPAVGALAITARPAVVRTVATVVTVSPGVYIRSPRARSRASTGSSPLGTMEPQAGNGSVTDGAAARIAFSRSVASVIVNGQGPASVIVNGQGPA